jgi:hypothetical protein
MATVNSDTLELEFDWELDLSMVYLYKIHYGDEYFLHDVKDGATQWTTRISRAKSFSSYEEADKFSQEHLPNRNDFSTTKR